MMMMMVKAAVMMVLVTMVMLAHMRTGKDMRYGADTNECVYECAAGRPVELEGLEYDEEAQALIARGFMNTCACPPIPESPAMEAEEVAGAARSRCGMCVLFLYVPHVRLMCLCMCTYVCAPVCTCVRAVVCLSLCM